MNSGNIKLFINGIMCGLLLATLIVCVNIAYTGESYDRLRRVMEDIQADIDKWNEPKVSVIDMQPPYEPSLNVQGGCGGACNR